MLPNGFNDYIPQMRKGVVPTSREFECPLCGGIGHMRIGTLATRPPDWLWMEIWCEDCGFLEKSDGVLPWPGYEVLLETDAQHFELADNLQRIRRFAQKNQQLQALRLYREIYGTDLQTARQAIEKLINEE